MSNQAGSSCINFVWLGTTTHLHTGNPSPPETMRSPISDAYLDNVVNAALVNPHADVKIWFDELKFEEGRAGSVQSAIDNRIVAHFGGDWGRMTPDQQHEAHQIRNRIQIESPRASIQGFATEPLYQQDQLGNDWKKRDGAQDAVFWRQIDSAKVLVTVHALHQGYDTVAFLDFDKRDVNLNDPQITQMLQGNGAGFVVGQDHNAIENQAWIATQQATAAFEELYETTLDVCRTGGNGFNPMNEMVGQAIRSYPGPSFNNMVEEAIRQPNFDFNKVLADYNTKIRSQFLYQFNDIGQIAEVQSATVPPETIVIRSLPDGDIMSEAVVERGTATVVSEQVKTCLNIVAIGEHAQGQRHILSYGGINGQNLEETAQWLADNFGNENVRIMAIGSNDATPGEMRAFIKGLEDYGYTQVGYEMGGGWERDVILHSNGSVEIQRGGLFAGDQELRCSDVYTEPRDLPCLLQRPLEANPPLNEKVNESIQR